MHKDVERVIYSQQQLSEVCDRLALEINNDYKGKKVVVIGILKGCIMFYSDLFRRLDIDCTMDFMAAASYGGGTQSSGNVRITKDITADISGRDVIIVEDILDTGNTLSYIKEYLESRSPSSVRICTLLDKPSRRKKDIKADYKGFIIDDIFIVGYGLDYDEKYRNLPYIGVLRSEAYR